MAVFTVVFGRLVHVPSDGIPYVLFVFTGMIVGHCSPTGWTARRRAWCRTRRSSPRSISLGWPYPLARVCLGLLDFGISLLLLAMLVVGRRPPGHRCCCSPLVVVWCLVLTFGVGLTSATVQVRYRDAHHALGLSVQVWLYAQPGGVLQQPLVPANWRWVYALNPMVGLLDTAFAGSLLGTTTAPGAPSMASLAPV